MKRNHSIDVIKFVFSLVVVLYHFKFLFVSGYLVVEGFFMISGFLMMNTIYSQKKELLLEENSTARFVFKKYSALFFPLLYSAISGFLIYEKLIGLNPAQPVQEKIPYLLFEIFPLQVAGFQAFYATGVSWYLSAMFLGLALIHPFAKRNPERFAYTVCPPTVLLCYGFLCFQGSNLDLPCTWFLGYINSGLIRGIAGLCAGCLLFVLAKKSTEQNKSSLLSRFGFSLLAFAGWFFFFQSITNEKLLRTSHDYITTAVLFGVLYLELSQKTLLSLVFRHRWTGALSTISSYVFMNHYPWAQYFLNRFPNASWKKVLPWFLLCVAVSSVAVFVLTQLSELILKKLRALKSHSKCSVK